MYLHNYLGMIGIPMDMHPYFPDDRGTILLTEQAKFLFPSWPTVWWIWKKSSREFIRTVTVIPCFHKFEVWPKAGFMSWPYLRTFMICTISPRKCFFRSEELWWRIFLFILTAQARYVCLYTTITHSLLSHISLFRQDTTLWLKKRVQNFSILYQVASCPTIWTERQLFSKCCKSLEHTMCTGSNNQ